MTVILCYVLKLAIVSFFLLGLAQSYRFRLCRENTVVKTRSLLQLSCKISDGDDIVASVNMENADNRNQKNVMDTIVDIPISESLVTPIDSAVTTNFTVIDKATSPVTQSIAMSTDASVTAEPSATQSATVISPEDFHVVTRVDPKDEIRHLEMYLKRRKGGRWWAFLIRFLPHFLRPKPCAKMGVRTYTSSSAKMDKIVVSTFGERSIEKSVLDNANNNYDRLQIGNKLEYIKNNKNRAQTIDGVNKWILQSPLPLKSINPNLKIGLFVYMWINPLFRRNGNLQNIKLGDYLLEYGKNVCRSLGGTFMLLVHDDKGSGKLVDYYRKKGFTAIFDDVDNGMLCEL